MKKNNLLLAILLLFPLIGFAQWETTDITGFGTPPPKEALTMVKVGSKLVVAINGSGIYTSTDAGENWAADNGGFTVATTEAVLYMITNGNNIYFTTANGVWKADGTVSPLAWTKIGTKGTAPIPNNSLTQMAFIGTDLYVGTNGGGIVKNANLAGTWALIPHPKDSLLPTPADSKNILSMINDDNKLLVGFDNDKTGARLYDPAFNTWSDVSAGLKVTGNMSASLNARNDNSKFYQRIRYFYKDGTTIYAATKRAFKDFNHKGIYSCTSGTYNWVANSTGLVNREATAVLSFAKVGPNIVAATNYSGLSMNNGTGWSESIMDVAKSSIVLPDGANAYICSNVGVYKYDGTNMVSKSVGLPTNAAVNITDIKFNNGLYYAATSNGVFTSTTGKGSWTRLATNDVAKNVTSITFSATNIYASINQVVHKLIVDVWEPVAALKNYTILPQITAYNAGGTDYIFAGGAFAEVPVGIFRSADGGATWAENFTLTGTVDSPTARSAGFYNGSDGRYMVSGIFRYNATTNTLICPARAGFMFSKDHGLTWYTRETSGNIVANIKYSFMREYKGASYAFVGGQNDASSNRDCVGGVIDDNVVANFADKGYSKAQSEGASMNEYGEDLLFLNQMNSIYKSEDNGVVWTPFNTGLTSGGIGRGSFTYTLNGLMLFRGINQTIQVYDLATAPTWTATYPKTGTIASGSADLLVKNTRAGKAYYVVLPEADAPPTEAQVIAGKDASDAVAAIKGNLVVSKNVEATLPIIGLSANTSYKVYSVVQSEVIKTTGLQAVSFSTISTALDNPKMVTAIYPVPAKGLLNVTMAVDARVSITNLLGAQLIATQGKAGETLKIDVSQLQAGVYLVETNNGINKRIEKITIK
ncbi:MAG: T9SS type A sorting domain-containing protein [Paludibacter sp.]